MSWTPGGEYEEKLDIYAKLGVLYYIIYNPEYWQRDRDQPFEVYKLVDEVYQLQIGEPYWMPEISIGIGRHQTIVGGIQREVLTWYDQQRNPYLTAEEQAEQERQRAERLAARLRELGEDPEQL